MTLTNHGKTWTPSEEMQMLTLLDAGAPLTHLVEKIGRTPYAIVTRLQQLGALCLINRAGSVPYYAKVSADAWIGFKEVNELSKEYDE